MLRFITTADTEILATAGAVERLPDGFPEVRCANPGSATDHGAFVDDVLADARVVLCRVLGGRRGWPEGFDLLRARCAERGIALLALGGEAQPDAEMTALSLAPVGAVAQAGEYLRHGDIDNVEQLLRFLADTFLLEGYGFAPPREVPDLGVYVPGAGDVPLARALEGRDPGRPTVGVCFYRSHRLTGNTAFVDALCAAIEDAGGNAVAVWSYTLRRDADGRVPALELLAGNVDALVVTMLATGGSSAGDAVVAEGGDGVGEAWQEWDASALADLGVPVIQAVCATASRASWQESDSGLAPLDAATQVAIPEFDGRLLGGVISFKERDAAGSRVGVPVPHYAPDLERCSRVARLAVRTARLRTLPAEQRRVAVLLTSFPTKHAKVGMAVGLDTPASALRLFEAFAADGMRVEHSFAHGDELMHALIAAGGHDAEFLTDDQLAASPLRLPVSQYLAWYAELPESLREAIESRWGPPPGDRFVDGDDFVIAGLELGNVLVAIQPPRGYGDDPVGIYHDPELPPTHHYLACYWWLDRVWGADALVHLGKHGTLEWLPGKTLALSAECAPDAALGDLPLVYPFVVNDPGEGVQAKRRVHAVIVDHLVPPMMRADTYDEMAELEALLDEYARLDVLDPSKLPSLAVQIWDAIERANLQSDLHIEERPDDVATLVEHIDGYLCEVKDIQIKDGLHVLGQPPRGDQMRGLVSAILRLGSGDVPGLRSAVGAAFGLDEPALVAAAGSPAPAAVPELVSRFRGPSASAGDLVDRLEAAQMALLDALAARDWDAAERGHGVPRRARPPRRRRGARAELRRARGHPAHPADHERARQRDRGAQRAARALRPLGQPHARARRRAPDRAQLLLRRPARAALRALVGGRRAARRRAARPLPRGDRRAAAHGRPRGVGDVRDADAGRRRRRDPRADRRAPDVAPRVAPRHRHRGHPARAARPAAHRRDRAHLGVLPRRVPAPRRAARRRHRQGRGARRACRSELRRGARARGRRAARLRARRGLLAARDDARLRVRSPAPTAPGCCSSWTRATGAATPTSPRSTRPGAASPTGAASRASAPATRCATASAASRSPSRTSTRASTTSSTPTTTTSTTAAWSRPCARSPGASRRPTSATAPTPRASSRAASPRRRAACSARASPTRAGSRR